MINILKIIWNVVSVILMLVVKMIAVLLWLPLKLITLTFLLIGWIVHDIGFFISAFIVIGGIFILFSGELHIMDAVSLFVCIMILAALPLVFTFFCYNVVEYVDAISIFIITCSIFILTVQTNSDSSIRKDFRNFRQQREEKSKTVSNSNSANE